MKHIFAPIILACSLALFTGCTPGTTAAAPGASGLTPAQITAAAAAAEAAAKQLGSLSGIFGSSPSTPSAPSAPSGPARTGGDPNNVPDAGSMNDDDPDEEGGD